MNKVTLCRSFGLVQFALAAVFLSGLSGLAATFSVSPDVISNDYRGVVVLQIGGLTNGESVLVEKFADFNGNASVDGDDFLMQSLRLTDGVVRKIGGATNYNVPSDVNGANGTITTPLNFAGIDLEHIVGQYTFRATSPGRFTNIASFTVTNSIHAQSISGVVRCGTTNLSRALIVLLSPENDYMFCGGTVADTNGNYSLKVQPGLYAVVAAKSNYVYGFGNPAIANVTSNANLVTNLSLWPATTYISGKLADWNTTNGLPGVFGVCQSADGFLTVGWTGPEGEIGLPVTSNVWRLRADSLHLARLGYVYGEDGLPVDTTQGPATNVLAQVPQALAMFYGTVKTGAATPLAGIRFDAYQQSGGLGADGFSDANGNYSLGVMPGSWWCEVSDDFTFRQSYVFAGETNATFGSNQAIRVDFIAKPVTATITGWVRDLTGAPVSGVEVYGHADIGGRNYSARTGTDGDGNYSLYVAAGSWRVGLGCWGDNGLENSGYECVNEQVASVPPTNAVLNFTIYPMGTPRLDTPVFTSPGQLFLTLHGRPGTNYVVQVSTNLADPLGWNTLTNFTATGNVSTVWDDRATDFTRFYRAMMAP